MIKIILILVFFIIFSASFVVECQEVSTQEGTENVQCEETATENPQSSFLDQATDWWATLGKNEEEKVQILEERRLKRLESPQSTVEELKNKTQEKVSLIKEETMNRGFIIKEEAKNKAASLKEEVGQRVAETKEKTYQNISQTKERAKQKIGEAKTKISSNVETKKRQIKQESEKSIAGFLDGLFK
ncbi:MAG: hypothetical protein FJZ10_04990 [Candidatus Omnitrophica bacterium]|nr:hypothetical protein [Candidatus Omnitrophota bacterium]